MGSCECEWCSGGPLARRASKDESEAKVVSRWAGTKSEVARLPLCSGFWLAEYGVVPPRRMPSFCVFDFIPNAMV